ncbi:uncharacterized protein LOC127739346 [Mytilus californianus]|uniref:uncharacterized protein LOC127739346 n=1 Tax=Mytilus californianus TaxID=6549 RepID=UPI002247EB7D|nr:uncharacterized protein LOC127739346 [Mytilus californianus]
MAECSNSGHEMDIVKCGICLSDFAKPILLRCFHIFCTPCVSKLTEGKQTLICPLCRAVQELPHKGVDGLSLYPYVQMAGSQDNVTVQCQMCDNDKIAVSNCIDCKSKMCFECSAYHLKHKLFKTNKTEKIESEHTEIKSPEAKNLDDFSCEAHNEQFSLYCEPCNQAICQECATQNHKLHKSEPIMFQAQRRRDLLRSAIGAIKSKIAGLDQEREISKFAEKNHYKLCKQWKDEIRTHANRSKETLCKIVDLLADVNLKKIDEMQKEDIKSINNFQDELETKKLSLLCLLRSTKDIVKCSSDGKLLNDYTFLYQTLCNAVTKDNQLMVFSPQFCFGNQLEHKYIENCFGLVMRGEKPNMIGASESHIYSLPIICAVNEFKKMHSFNINYFQNFYGACEDKTWILQNYEECIKLYSANGVDLRYTVPKNDAEQILRATQNELWIKSGGHIKKITVETASTTEEIVHMPEFANATCSVLDDNRIIAYSVQGKCFYDVTIDGDWPVNINETTLKIIPVEETIAVLITEKPLSITETVSKHIIIPCREKVITFDRNFRVCNVHENKGSSFGGSCGDHYGNIFIVDTNLNKICVLNSYGEFLHDVSIQGISSPIYITRDSMGNIWLTDSGNKVHIYSYL